MPSDFFSLNSWSVPGILYQGSDPAEVVEGGPGEWALLREALRRGAARVPQGRGKRADRPHPEGGAVGFFRYDGSFRFGIYPEIEALAAAQENPGWKARRDALPDGPAFSGPEWRADLDAAGFASRVRRIQEYIAAGDIYQVNLTHRFRTPFAGNPYRLFECLVERSPAPGAAFLKAGETF
ncbi:MAG TPA: chorismate-binding protein, partial [Candidatus Methylacidiphilales bacterium]